VSTDPHEPEDGHSSPGTEGDDRDSPFGELAQELAAVFSSFAGGAVARKPGAANRPGPPPAPSAPAKTETPAAPAAPAASPPAAAPAAPAAAAAPKSDSEADAVQRLSGKHWAAIAGRKWPESSRIEDLGEAFRPKAQSFIAMLNENHVDVDVASTLRPPERAYLYHYCLEVAAGRIAPNAVPRLATVDIEWDHGDAETSKAAASEMASAFGLVGVAAYPSNHSGGNALDMKMGFGRNTRDGKTSVAYRRTPSDDPVTRELAIGDEAVIGTSARGKRIAGIADRELSKAGSDFGVVRAIDSDIVHWSLDGR
jgi:hypothetical protein